MSRELANPMDRLHQQASPALSLPPEILSVIFTLSNPLPGPNSLQLGHVCRQWRHVLLGLSEYWVDVVFYSKFRQETDVFFLSCILARSSPRPIKLFSIHLCPSITTILASNWHRVVFLSVLILNEDHLRSLHTVLQQSQTSSLCDLMIFQSTDHGLSPSDLVPLPHGALPTLRRLLSPIRYLPYIAVSSLCHLDVCGPSGYPLQHPFPTQTLSTLFDCLAICTELETLSIGSMSPIGLETPSEPRTIHLRRLQKLSIRNIRASTILSTLRFSDTATVELDCWSERTNMDEIREVLSHTRPRADTVHLTTEDGRFLVLDLLDDNALRLHTQFRTALMNSPAEIAYSLPARSGVTTLEWNIEDLLLLEPTAPRWGILLSAFPALTRLVARRHDPWTLASALAFASYPPGNIAPPCPLLSELIVVWQADEMERATASAFERAVMRAADEGKEAPAEWMAGATPVARVHTVAQAVLTSLLHRAEYAHVQPLARVELVEHDLSVAAGAAGGGARVPVQEIEEVLAPLCHLVHGPVIFRKMSGPIA